VVAPHGAKTTDGAEQPGKRPYKGVKGPGREKGQRAGRLAPLAAPGGPADSSDRESEMRVLTRAAIVAALLCPGVASKPASAVTVTRQSWIVTVQYRILITVTGHRCGLAVAGVAPGSPARNMIQVANPTVSGALEIGDVITHINGKRVCGLCCLHKALNNGGCRLTLTVIDCRTGAVVNWSVQPVKVLALFVQNGN
jgi:hypothetical protein